MQQPRTFQYDPRLTKLIGDKLVEKYNFSPDFFKAVTIVDNDGSTSSSILPKRISLIFARANNDDKNFSAYLNFTTALQEKLLRSGQVMSAEFAIAQEATGTPGTSIGIPYSVKTFLILCDFLNIPLNDCLEFIKVPEGESLSNVLDAVPLATQCKFTFQLESTIKTYATLAKNSIPDETSNDSKPIPKLGFRAKFVKNVRALLAEHENKFTASSAEAEYFAGLQQAAKKSGSSAYRAIHAACKTKNEFAEKPYNTTVKKNIQPLRRSIIALLTEYNRALQTEKDAIAQVKTQDNSPQKS